MGQYIKLSPKEQVKDQSIGEFYDKYLCNRIYFFQFLNYK